MKAWLPGSGNWHDVYWDDLPLLLAWARKRLRERLPMTYRLMTALTRRSLRV